jgi:hypothetical protein
MGVADLSQVVQQMKGRTNLCLNWSKRGCPVRRKWLTTMTASTPVPDEGELRLGTVRLPMGRQLQTENSDGEPVAWRTQAPVPDPGPVWSTLSALHSQTGLVPVLEPVGLGDLEVSFWDTAAVADVDQVDVAALLGQLWADRYPKPSQVDPEWDEQRHWADMAAPFTSQFPGLAPAVDTALTRDVLEAAVRSFPASRIVLVPADRPADVLPSLGWYPSNWFDAFPVPTPVGFAAVLRSWEERFGARLFGMTHDKAYLLIERPPRGLDAALPIAAEHFVFCDEPAGRQPVRTTAEQIVDAPVWHFWWD